MPTDKKKPNIVYDEADYKKLKDLVSKEHSGTQSSYTSPDFEGTRTDTGKPIYYNEKGQPIVYQDATGLTPVAAYDKKEISKDASKEDLEKLAKANALLKKKQEDRLKEYITNQVGVQATTPEEIKKAQSGLKEGQVAVPGYKGQFKYVGDAQSIENDPLTGKPKGEVHYNLDLVPEELQKNVPLADQNLAKTGEAYKDYITGYSQYQDETGKPFYVPQFGLASSTSSKPGPRNIYKDNKGVYFTQNPDGSVTSIPFNTAEQQLRAFPQKIQELQDQQAALQGRVGLANKLLETQTPIPIPEQTEEVPLQKLPFGGLINKGVTGISKALGANDKTAELIGSGVATATGFIPGMQDNLFQGVDLVGDTLSATNNNKAANVVNTIDSVTPLVSQLAFAYGGPMKKKIYDEGGNLTQYNGMPHEQGGIPLGNTGNEVEDGETRNQDFIFSERIKLPWNKKKSFAEESKRIEGKYKDRKGDKMAEEALQRELDLLKAKQEEHKMKIQKKMESLGALITDENEMAGGGNLNFKSNAAYKAWLAYGHASGEFEKTPGHQKVSIQGNSKNVKHANGGGLDPINAPEVDPFAISPYALQPINAPEAELAPYSEPTFRLKEDPSMQTDPRSQQLPNQELGAMDYIGAAIPTLTRAATLIGGPKETNFENFNPELVSLQAQRDALKRQSDIAKTQGARMIGEQAGGSGNALANLVAMNAAINQSQGDQTGQSYLNEALQNTGIKNQAGMFNTQMDNQEIIANEQNQANFMNQLIATGDTFAGTMSGLRKDQRLYNSNNQYNQMGLETLNSIFPNYQYQLGEGWQFKTNG